MPEGWVLDAHQDGTSGQMSVWIKEDGGKASLHVVPWSPVLHVSGSPGKLRMLSDGLGTPESKPHEAISSLEKGADSHESTSQTEVLAVEVSRTGMLSGWRTSYCPWGSGRTSGLLRGPQTHSEVPVRHGGTPYEQG